MNVEKIGKFIQKKRLEKGLTQKELGDLLYVTGKAVSKWERGLSIPDISLLEHLAEVLDTDIYAILQIKKKDNYDIENIIKEEKKKLKRQLSKRLRFGLILAIIIIIVILYKLLPFGYQLKVVDYHSKTINLGVPAYSFLIKKTSNGYRFQNLRNSYALKTEIKNYLNTLEHISCNKTTYYYDHSTDMTIIDYNVKNNLLYNTIEYQIENGNYCKNKMIENFREIVKGFDNIYKYSSYDKKVTISFHPQYDLLKDEFIATMIIQNHDIEKKETVTLESSSGTFEITEAEIIYIRTDIKESKLTIPPTTSFIIKNDKLIMVKNYLTDYATDIVLE